MILTFFYNSDYFSAQPQSDFLAFVFLATIFCCVSSSINWNFTDRWMDGWIDGWTDGETLSTIRFSVLMCGFASMEVWKY